MAQLCNACLFRQLVFHNIHKKCKYMDTTHNSAIWTINGIWLVLPGLLEHKLIEHLTQGQLVFWNRCLAEVFITLFKDLSNACKATFLPPFFFWVLMSSKLIWTWIFQIDCVTYKPQKRAFHVSVKTKHW